MRKASAVSVPPTALSSSKHHRLIRARRFTSSQSLTLPPRSRHKPNPPPTSPTFTSPSTSVMLSPSVLISLLCIDLVPTTSYEYTPRDILHTLLISIVTVQGAFVRHTRVSQLLLKPIHWMSQAEIFTFNRQSKQPSGCPTAF